MKKAIITGGNGFVAKYLASDLIDLGYTVIGTTRISCSEPLCSDRFKLVQIDDKNVDEWADLINEFNPDEIYHLAGQSSVGLSWSQKVETFNSNVIYTINMLEGLRLSKWKSLVKVLTVGSSEEYGHVNCESAISETVQLKPISPYGISKINVFHLMKQFTRTYGMNIIHVRPFNHIGPGQGVGFVTSDFARQIVEIERKLKEPTLMVGNLEAQRDFTDVRDIVKAYKEILQFGSSGEVYNVCSGKPISISTILQTLLKLSKYDGVINITQDHNKMRPSDYMVYYGDNTKLFSDTNWRPEIEMEKSLNDILDYWRSSIPLV
ncbi:GDP-mannose 4,6-dehydratase [Paenibacillus sp.]|uniref:GDP-mannose 4,6-dehydratase n=1 Tax=Paenibacillus sp. TaxID=58172 RepID=UPI0028A591FF|nr:GDP-mannose 4,6-dehydratase [Paenibacillus sp.]